MKLPHICFIMNKISDLSESAALKLPNSISELRKHVNMLVIDDNEFGPEAYLKANGYQIHHKQDIETIKDIEPYDIILCDISGVGKKLGYQKEGAFIIREIHENYPNTHRSDAKWSTVIHDRVLSLCVSLVLRGHAIRKRKKCKRKI